MLHACTVTGDGTTKTIAAWCTGADYTLAELAAMRPSLFQATCEGPGVARVGDINTTATYGSPIPGTSAAQPGAQLFPAVPQVMHTYSFTSTYVFIPSGTVVSFIWDA